jgi:hypothetical protein
MSSSKREAGRDKRDGDGDDDDDDDDDVFFRKALSARRVTHSSSESTRHGPVTAVDGDAFCCGAVRPQAFRV